MNEEKIIQAACASTSDWDRLQPLLKQEGEAVVTTLLEKVDQSDYSLPDWIQALLRFDQWLSDQKIDARPTSSMIGYIHCCTMTSPDTLHSPELARLTCEMLEQHGFEAVDDSQSTP